MLVTSVQKIVTVQFLTLLQGLVFAFFATKILEPDLFGELRYLLVWLAVLMAGTLPTYDNIILREASSKNKLNLTRIVRSRFRFGTFSMTAMFLVFFCYSIYFKNILSIELCFLLVLIPAYEIFTGYRNYLIGLGFKDEVLSMQIRNRILSLFILLIGFSLSELLNFGVLALMILFMAAQTAPNIYMFLRLGLVHKHKIHKAFEDEKALNREAQATSFASLIWLFASNLDKIVVGEFLGAEDLAYYSILVMLPLTFAQFFDAFITTWYREIFTKKIKWRETKIIALIFFVIALVFLCFVFGLYLFVPYIFGEFYSYSWTLCIFGALLALTSSLELLQFQLFFRFKALIFMYIYNITSIFIVFSSVALFHQSLSIILVIKVMIIKQLLLPLSFMTYGSLKWYKVCR